MALLYVLISGPVSYRKYHCVLGRQQLPVPVAKDLRQSEGSSGVQEHCRDGQCAGNEMISDSVFDRG